MATDTGTTVSDGADVVTLRPEDAEKAADAIRSRRSRRGSKTPAEATQEPQAATNGEGEGQAPAGESDAGESPAKAEASKPRQMRLDGFEGRQVDSVKVAFAGGIAMNVFDTDIVVLLKQLKLHGRVTLEVSAVVADKAWGRKVDSEGNVDTTHTLRLTVDTINVASAQVSKRG